MGVCGIVGTVWDGSDSSLLHVLIKADVQGSAEALADAVAAVKTENASVHVLRAGKKRFHKRMSVGHSGDRRHWSRPPPPPYILTWKWPRLESRF